MLLVGLGNECFAEVPTLSSSMSIFAVAPKRAHLLPVQAQSLRDHSAGPSNPFGTLRPSTERAQQERYGSVVGRLIDQTGDGIAGAEVQLKCEQDSRIWQVQSDEDGRFRFDNITPGRFQLLIAEEGFLAETVSSTLAPDENYLVPTITMHLATLETEIRVTPSAEELAEDEFKDLEQQHVLGFIPNLYVSYVPQAVPLTKKRKFELACKGTTDPVTFGAIGIIAGVGQATNRFSGFGQGTGGYAMRYGASYANSAAGLWIGGAVLPSILKQDPRYFYKGTGSKRSRFLYAISRPFVCKGDNQHWQPNYSSVLGDLAAGGISNLYIPERDHGGAHLTFENAGIALGTTVAIDVLQEFVLHRLMLKRH